MIQIKINNIMNKNNYNSFNKKYNNCKQLNNSKNKYYLNNKK